jgi:SAM-dependent methyltransferase
MTSMMDTASARGRRDALAEQVFKATLGAQEVAHVYLGHTLGLYRALAECDTATSAGLAAAAGIDERYAREWLEQQAVCGYLDVAQDSGDARTRRYRLPDGAAEVLGEPESLYFMAPLSGLVVGIMQALPQVAEAFRSGGGVPYAAYGAALREGIEATNRPMFTHQLATDWIPAMTDVEQRLREGDPPARVADLGCGSGWSAIALARAYPHVSVDGVDLDEASVRAAQRHVSEAGLADRVQIICTDAADSQLAGRYDLVTMFETLHDMAHPVEALRGARAMLAAGGAVLVGDERVSDTFTAPGDELDRFNYGWSAVHCLAVALAEPDAAGTGTVIRPPTVRRYGQQAGFSVVSELPIEHDFWRFYRMDP